MRLIDGKIFLEYSECVQAGISANTINKGKSRGTIGWEFLECETDKRKVLIQYDALKPEYKEKIISNLCGGIDP